MLGEEDGRHRVGGRADNHVVESVAVDVGPLGRDITAEGGVVALDLVVRPGRPGGPSHPHVGEPVVGAIQQVRGAVPVQVGPGGDRTDREPVERDRVGRVAHRRSPVRTVVGQDEHGRGLGAHLPEASHGDHVGEAVAVEVSADLPRQPAGALGDDVAIGIAREALPHAPQSIRTKEPHAATAGYAAVLGVRDHEVVEPVAIHIPRPAAHRAPNTDRDRQQVADPRHEGRAGDQHHPPEPASGVGEHHVAPPVAVHVARAMRPADHRVDRGDRDPVGEHVGRDLRRAEPGCAREAGHAPGGIHHQEVRGAIAVDVARRRDPDPVRPGQQRDPPGLHRVVPVGEATAGNEPGRRCPPPDGSTGGDQEEVVAAVAVDVTGHLDLRPRRVGDTDLCPYDAGTWGSMTTRFFDPVLRAAAIEARMELIKMASVELKVPEDQLKTENGHVVSKADNNIKVSYGSLTKGKKIVKTVRRAPVFKQPAEFKQVGKQVHATNALLKVTGKAKYSGDIQLPGMLYAAVSRPPAHGCKLLSVDKGKAAAMEGVKVIVIDNLVAVLHSNPNIAANAVAAIRAEWSKPEVLATDKTIFSYLVAEGKETRVFEEKGNVDLGFADADFVVETEYHDGYKAHASIETHTATAHFEGEKLIVWASTQSPFGTRKDLSARLKMPLENVLVKQILLGGGFGGKVYSEQAVEAALLAKESGCACATCLDQGRGIYVRSVPTGRCDADKSRSKEER